MKLAKGDFVECIGTEWSSLTKGKVYQVNQEGFYPDSFKITGDNGDELLCLYPFCVHGEWKKVENDK